MSVWMSKRRATNKEAMGGRETQRACEHRGAACEQRGAACEQRGAHADDPTHPTAHAGCERSSRAACDRRGVSAGMLVGSPRSVCVWTEDCRSMQVLGFVSEIVTRAIVNQGPPTFTRRTPWLPSTRPTRSRYLSAPSQGTNPATTPPTTLAAER